MCLGLSLRTGGGDLITGGDSAGEVFSEYTPLGAFNLVKGAVAYRNHFFLKPA